MRSGDVARRLQSGLRGNGLRFRVMDLGFWV